MQLTEKSSFYQMVVKYFHASFLAAIADQSNSGQFPQDDVTENRIIYQMNSNDDSQWFKQNLLTRFDGLFFLPDLQGGKTSAMVLKCDESSTVPPPLPNYFAELT